MNPELEFDPNPLVTLVHWHAAAREHGAIEPDAMTLATATPDGRPSARIVLYKGIVDGKIQFVTNFASRKGRELAANSAVALVFFWVEIQRQVRIEGRAEQSSNAASDHYFETRPRESQLGAWASEQSQVIATRSELEARYAEVERRFRDQPVQRPPNWGLYGIVPESVEFWHSRPSRLHDRTRYRRTSSGWVRDLLSP
jgi:pyridoxamine 5'-phosphate oxidase